MPIVCGIKFRGTGKVYHFAPGDLKDLQVDDNVIVETARGVEMGQVAVPSMEITESEVVAELKPILRLATPADLLDAQSFREQEPSAVAKCRELVTKSNLPMKVVGAEYNYDGSRLTFYFTSEQRVDFRDLVRELAHVFRTRIELRQIGVRDEAKMMGGMGKCGRSLCCATWLTEFCPVSIRMAKQQDLPLSPMEISGLCGRLLCCLDFENSYYQEVKGRFPKVGKSIETPMGPGKAIHVSALRETVTVLFEDGTTLELTAEQLAGKAPLPAKPEGEAAKLNDRQRRALEVALPTSPTGTADESPSDAGEAVGEQVEDGEKEPEGHWRADQRRQGKPRAAIETQVAPTQGQKETAVAGHEPRAGQLARRRSRPHRAHGAPSQGQTPTHTGRVGDAAKQNNPEPMPGQPRTGQPTHRPHRRRGPRREDPPSSGSAQ
jgi:cell fate regulator YaaT (PSP1 superfamily)